LDGVRPQGALYLHNGPRGGVHGVGFVDDQRLGRDQGADCIVLGCDRAIAAPDIHQALARSPAHRRLTTKRVRPEPVKLVSLQGLGGENSKGSPWVVSARHRDDVHVIRGQLNAGVHEQASQGVIRSGCGPEAEPLDRLQIAPLGRQVGAQH
jgi:hypothetical protein